MQNNKCYRSDGYAKVTGSAVYADDINYGGMYHMVPVYTQFSCATDVKIDIKDAKKLNGVIKVITHKDVPGSLFWGVIEHDYPIVIKDTVRSPGDVCALVVAKTREIALEASKLIKVSGKEIEPILTIEDALKKGARAVTALHKTNIVNKHCLIHGNTETAFKDCELVFEKEFETKMVEHAYMEPETVVAVPRYDGVIEIYASIQHVFSTRRFCAGYLGEPLANFDVKCISVGGSFGGKDDAAAVVCARAALAARLLNKPVKLRYEREWSMCETYKRPAYKLKYKVGVTSEGVIKAVVAKMFVESGAYLSTNPWFTWRSTAQCVGPYAIENVKADVFGVATNRVYSGAMRGFGAPPVNFSFEQMIDEIAYRLKIHPLGIRRLNMVKQNSTTITNQILDNHIVSMEQVMNSVTSKIGFRKKYMKCSFGKSESDELYGIGLSISYRGTSLGAEGMDFATAIINAQYDGSIILDTGIHEFGQGSESAMILYLAEQLGCSVDRIRYRQSSTSSVPDSGTTVASRGTLMGTSAIAEACINFKKIVNENIADKLGCKPEEITYKDDKIWGLENNSLTWKEAMLDLFFKRITPYAFGTFKAPHVSWDEEVGQGDAYFTYVYSCNAAEVIVNKKNGNIKVINFVSGHDVGKAINPPMIRGQVFGGVTMAIGQTLMEEVKFDDKGKVTTQNFNTYKIPRSTDIPKMECIIIENSDPLTKSGVKGIGEPGLELAAPAIANAIYCATGKRYTSMPIKIDPKELANE